jgi:hypothetical protein
VGMFRRALGGCEEYSRCLCSAGTILVAGGDEKNRPLEGNLTSIRILCEISYWEYFEQKERHSCPAML